MHSLLPVLLYVLAGTFCVVVGMNTYEWLRKRRTGED